MRDFVRLITLTAFIAAPSLAQAGPVTCPDPPVDGERVFTLDTNPDSSCLDFGTGPNDINGNGQDVMVMDGWTAIDKDDADGSDDPNPLFEDWLIIDGNGTLSGTFDIDPDAWDMWDMLAIGFKVGGGQQVCCPDWAVFLLAKDVLTGGWSISPPQGSSLSHAILYGMDGDNTVTEIPEPASLLLVGGGLMAAVRRRRAKR